MKLKGSFPLLISPWYLRVIGYYNTYVNVTKPLVSRGGGGGTNFGLSARLKFCYLRTKYMII